MVTHSDNSQCQVQGHQHDSWKSVGVTKMFEDVASSRLRERQNDIPGDPVNFRKIRHADALTNPTNAVSREQQSRRCQHSNEGVSGRIRRGHRDHVSGLGSSHFVLSAVSDLNCLRAERRRKVAIKVGVSAPCLFSYRKDIPSSAAFNEET
jgi:hypothetical protein